MLVHLHKQWALIMPGILGNMLRNIWTMNLKLELPFSNFSVFQTKRGKAFAWGMDKRHDCCPSGFVGHWFQDSNRPGTTDTQREGEVTQSCPTLHYNHPIKWRALKKTEHVLFYSVFTGYRCLTQQMTTDVSAEWLTNVTESLSG